MGPAAAANHMYYYCNTGSVRRAQVRVGSGCHAGAGYQVQQPGQENTHYQVLRSINNRVCNFAHVFRLLKTHAHTKYTQQCIYDVSTNSLLQVHSENLPGRSEL